VKSVGIKLLILALDGLDPNLLERWRERLPNLSALAERGAFRPLASTVPSMTFPAWSTFLTGVNPGEHGIFDFTARIPGRFELRFLNATRRRLPTFLRLASEQGLRVGSVGLPTTYPPEPLSGYQISGFDTPLPSKADTSYVYPRELGDRINRELGGYYFGNFNESRIGANWHRRVLVKLLEGIERKKDLFDFLQQESSVDVLLLHVGETDTVGHHFWSFYDRKSPRYIQSADQHLSDAILAVYQAADELVGHARKLLQPQTTIVISDHGMGGTSDRMIYLNRFLARCGLLRFSKSDSRSRWMGTLKNWGLKWIPYRFQQQIFRVAGGRLAAGVESIQRFGGIDWSRTLAYSEELNYFPSIYLNRAEREPHGIVQPAEVEQVADQIRSALLSWKDPLSGSPVVKAVHRREEVYSGSETVHAPDLILELNQPDGYSYALGRSTSRAGIRQPADFKRLDPKEYLGRKGGTMNGSHRRLGTLIIRSDDSIPPLPDDVSLLDLAPTILDLLQLDIPDWMEGKSLKSEGKRPPRKPFAIAEEKPYSPISERILRDRFVKLGYLG